MSLTPHGVARVVAASGGVAAALLVVAGASAQVATGTEHTVTGVAGYGAWDWISLTFRIGLVLAIIWGSVMAMRWYVRRMAGEGGGRVRALQIVETRTLGPNRSLHLVRLGNRAVLIGATAERINALMEIADPLQLERLFADDEEARGPSMAGFLSGLASMPARAARARDGVSARLEAAREAKSGSAGAADRASSRPQGAGIFTGLLTRLGQRMHRAKPAPAAAVRPPREEVRWDTAAPGLFAGLLGANTMPAGSLFDRTLAQATGVQDRLDARMPAPVPQAPPAARPQTRAAQAQAPAAAPAPSLASGLRARSGYQQMAPSPAELSREARLAELQRAIEYARRSAS